MKLRDLEALVAILQTATVSGAARALSVTQPAVSRMLARLEAELGFDLFYRQGGRLVPTRAAETIQAEARRIVDNIGELQQLCLNVRSGRAGEIKLGCAQGLIQSLIPHAVRIFSSDWQDVRIVVEPRPNRLLVEQIASHQLELGLLFLPIEHPGVEVEPLDWIASVCALPVGHPLAGHDRLEPRDLIEERLILLSKSDPARFPIEHAFRQARVVPLIRHETPSVTLAVRLAAEGCGIAIVNGLMAREAAGADVALVPFFPEIRHQIALIRPTDYPESAEAAAFSAILRRLVGESACS